MRIHLIFHILLLEPIKNLETLEDEVDDTEYEIERILDR